MKKLVPSHTIPKCYECIEYKRDSPSDLYYCRKMQRSTNNVGIPSWCPLENV